MYPGLPGGWQLAKDFFSRAVSPALAFEGPYAQGGAMSMADCTIAPLLFYVTRIIPSFGGGDPLADASNVAAYWEAIQRDNNVAGVLDQMGKALAAMQGG